MKNKSTSSAKAVSASDVLEAKAKNAPSVKSPEADTKPSLSVKEVEQMIATAAYYNAQKRSFEVGYEQEDWLVAEREIGRMFAA